MYLDSDKQMMIEFNPVYDIQLTSQFELKKHIEKINKFQTLKKMFRRMELIKEFIEIKFKKLFELNYNHLK